MRTIQSLFSWQGRLSRGAFWGQLILLWTAFFILNALLGELGKVVLALLSAVMLVIVISHCVRRLHDRGYSAHWLLVGLVPIAGALWLFWQLACKQGCTTDNQWGSNPINSTKNFLVVG